MAKRHPDADAAMRALGIDPASVKSLGILVPREPPAAPGKVPARYTKPGDDGMNKTERRYAAHLEARRLAGEIYRWDFQPEKFRLANKGDACFYTPDFRVLLLDGTVEFHETKGFMQEDALIKIKWFVRDHPYPLIVVRWEKGQWTQERREP